MTPCCLLVTLLGYIIDNYVTGTLVLILHMSTCLSVRLGYFLNNCPKLCVGISILHTHVGVLSIRFRYLRSLESPSNLGLNNISSVKLSFADDCSLLPSLCSPISRQSRRGLRI